MASDSLRKKWGTIFMGEREATMEQLDAMQEPVLRERQQKDQQQAYLERVRKRAADRAREILGEAYTERQKILAEAEQEIEQRRAKLMQDIEGLKENAVKLHKDAEAELARAKAVSAEAEEIRNRAHEEGLQLGMDQASQELKEFRADMGNELAQVMRAVEGQLENIAAFWRDDLAELVRVAVHSGTGYILETQHEAVLSSLVFQAINLLEQREVVSFRVNPEDESIVSDMFRAAREKAPELKQWIVYGDESIERGGLIAESGSGSVDLRRQNYQDLVNSILEHLSLPVREAEREASQVLHEQVAASAERFSEASGGAPEAVEDEMRQEAAAPDLPLAPEAFVPEAEPEVAASSSAPPAEPAAPLDSGDMLELPDDIFSLEADEVAAQVAGAEQPARSPLPPDFEQDVLPPLPEDTIQNVPGMPDPASPQGASSLAELEEELFPVNQDEEHKVLHNGGFLPNSGEIS